MTPGQDGLTSRGGSPPGLPWIAHTSCTEPQAGLPAAACSSRRRAISESTILCVGLDVRKDSIDTDVLIDQAVQRELESPGLKLLGEHDRQEQRVAVDGLVAGRGVTGKRDGDANESPSHFDDRAPTDVGFLHSLNVKVTGTLYGTPPPLL